MSVYSNTRSLVILSLLYYICLSVLPSFPPSLSPLSHPLPYLALSSSRPPLPSLTLSHSLILSTLPFALPPSSLSLSLSLTLMLPLLCSPPLSPSSAPSLSPIFHSFPPLYPSHCVRASEDSDRSIGCETEVINSTVWPQVSAALLTLISSAAFSSNLWRYR